MWNANAHMTIDLWRGQTMHAIPTSNISDKEIELLRRFGQNEAGPELRDLLEAIESLLQDDAEAISVSALTEELTPNQAASRLKMSRTHLYKLLDRGEIVSHKVGRDRRIRVVDLVKFEKRRQRDRHELAERFAQQESTRAEAIDEIAELL